MTPRRLEGKVAIVTGGASGIGAASVRRLAAEGARVAIAARTEADLKVAADEIRAKTKADVLAVPTDVTKAEQVKALVAKGILGPGAFETSDCRGTYAELSERGVTFLAEPTKRPYGTEATLRDNSGNWFSMTER